MKVVALAGGVGGAKLADGLAMVLPAGELTVVVNTGDDFTHLGLRICPDLDTVCYTLAGLANPTMGWGRENESWQALSQIRQLGGPDWFGLGDLDLGTHLVRTEFLAKGKKLSEVTREFCARWGVHVKVLPMSDDPVATIVHTRADGELAFQDYFVRRRCEPQVTGFHFQGIDFAKPAEGVLDGISQADLIVICPSNPWVSIRPILAIQGIDAAFNRKKVIAVSPIIGGQAIKGPAAKMYTELGIIPSSAAVAETYLGIISHFVMDNEDVSQSAQINGWGIMTLVTNTIMKNRSDRERLAREVLNFGTSQ